MATPFDFTSFDQSSYLVIRLSTPFVVQKFGKVRVCSIEDPVQIKTLFPRLIV